MDEEEKEIMDQKHAESTEKKKTCKFPVEIELGQSLFSQRITLLSGRKQCCLKVDEGGGCTDNDLKMAFCPR